LSATMKIPDVKRFKVTVRAVVITMALAFGTATAVHAQATDGWKFEAMPYLWAAGMKGDVGIGRFSADGVEASFSDIAKSLRFGFMGTFEGRKDRFGFLADAIYMQLSQTKPAPHNFLGDVHARPKQQAYTLAATWRAVDGDIPVDLVGGARVNDLKLDLDLSASALAPGSFAGEEQKLGRRLRRRTHSVSDCAAVVVGRLCGFGRRRLQLHLARNRGRQLCNLTDDDRTFWLSLSENRL